jgi:hypothetical protein
MWTAIPNTPRICGRTTPGPTVSVCNQTRARAGLLLRIRPAPDHWLAAGGWLSGSKFGCALAETGAAAHQVEADHDSHQEDGGGGEHACVHSERYRRQHRTPLLESGGTRRPIGEPCQRFYQCPGGFVAHEERCTKLTRASLSDWATRRYSRSSSRCRTWC